MSGLPRRTTVFLVALALVVAGWEAFVRLAAPRRVDARLVRALDEGRPVNVVVTLPFAPEDFHIRLFQGYGVVSGVQGTTVLLNRVRPEDVRQIARYYWIRRITLQEGEMR